MTKAWLIVLLFLIPLAYADPVLDAQKASLDVNAYKFIVQMDAAIEFGKDHNLSTDELEKIKEEFISLNTW